MAMRDFLGQGGVFRANNLIRLARTIKIKSSIVTYSNKEQQIVMYIQSNLPF